MIETVVVDLGGVAAKFRPEARTLASLSGLPETTIQERLFDSGLEDRAEMGEYSPRQVVEAVRVALGGAVPVSAIVDAWALAFEPDADILEKLAGLPVRRVLFTNNGPMLNECLLGPLQSLASGFDEVICSWQLRARKPDRAAFEHAAALLGGSTDRLLLLDDSAPNVEAALRCGWSAACVSNLDGVAAALARHPELRSASD